MIIKAISLWQPWATAWTLGLKRGETRHWAPKAADGVYRGPLAVHAAKTDRDPQTRESLRELMEDEMAYVESSQAAFSAAGIRSWDDLPRGAIIGVCWLDNVKPAEECTPSELEQHWGNYAAGRFIWFPAQMYRLPQPIPCLGRQGLFNWEIPADVLALREVQNAIAEPPF